MINPIEQLEFLEKQSKSSSGITLVLCYIFLAMGFLSMYASTLDLAIKNKIVFGFGSAIVMLTLVLLLMQRKIKDREEKLPMYQELYSDAIQMLKDDLDLSKKLIEYNEKAIKYNENHEEPKMQIFTYADLGSKVEQHFDAYYSLFKKP